MPSGGDFRESSIFLLGRNPGALVAMGELSCTANLAVEVGVQTWPERRKGRQEGEGEETWGERVDPGRVDSGPSLGDHASQPSLSGLSGARILPPAPPPPALPPLSTKLLLSSLSHVSHLSLPLSVLHTY